MIRGRVRTFSSGITGCKCILQYLSGQLGRELAAGRQLPPEQD